MTRQEIISKAKSYVKQQQYPNPNKFTRWFFKNKDPHAWCGVFIDYIFKHDFNSNMLDSCSNFAYVPTIVSWAKEKGFWTKDYKKAKQGDLVIYNWDLDKKDNYSHVGIIDNIDKTIITSVEGNTSNDKYKDSCVSIKKRNKKYVSGVVLLPYKEDEMNLKIGDYVYAKEDIKLYTTIEYKESKYTLKQGDKAYIRNIRNNNVALANPDTKEYFISAWTNELTKLTKDIDYKKLYEEELKINKDLQNKMNQAIDILKH